MSKIDVYKVEILLPDDDYWMLPADATLMTVIHRVNKTTGKHYTRISYFQTQEELCTN